MSAQSASKSLFSLNPARSKLKNSGRGLSIETIGAGIVVVAIMFNSVLAVLNANLMGISRTHVILVEVVIVALALAVCLVSANRTMIPWVGIMWFLVTVFLCLSIARQSIEPKFLRDVLLIPVFVILGMTFAKGNIVKLFCWLQAVILGVMIIEGLAPGAYGRAINPWDYYSNTRWAIERTPWHEISGLYWSAVRPGGRILFDSIGLHRLSSIFLEPVSLGNWCVTITIFVTAFWRELPVKTAVFLIVSNVILLIGCDGRLALATSIIVVLLAVLARKLPRYGYLAYLPGVVVLATILVVVLDIQTVEDTFFGRIARGLAALVGMDFPALFGLDESLFATSADSGIGYLIFTQSIVGATVLWIFICILQPTNNRRALILMHGLCAYLALGLMVSYSIFSIKTAAPIWFLYGYVAARGAILENSKHRPTAP